VADKLAGDERENKGSANGGSQLGSHRNQANHRRQRARERENNSSRQRSDDYARLNVVSRAERVVPMVEQLRGMPPHTSREDQKPGEMDKLAPHSDKLDAIPSFAIKESIKE